MYKIDQLVKYGSKAYKVIAYATGDTGCVLEMDGGWRWNKRCPTKKYDVFSKTLHEGTNCWWVPYSELKPIAILRKG